MVRAGFIYKKARRTGGLVCFDPATPFRRRGRAMSINMLHKDAHIFFEIGFLPTGFLRFHTSLLSLNVGLRSLVTSLAELLPKLSELTIQPVHTLNRPFLTGVRFLPFFL